MSQSHYGSFSMYSEMPPSLTLLKPALGSALLRRIVHPLPNVITLGSGSCISFFLKNFHSCTRRQERPSPRQAARHTEVAEQNDKGQCFGLTKTSSCNSLMKASISDYASSSPVSCTPCPKSQALPSLLPCVWLSLSGVRCWVHSEGAP